MQYIVIDFGGTLAKYAVMDENANVLLRGEQKAPVDTKEAFFDFIVKLYEAQSKEQKIDGIAISMPGVIDEKQGYVKTAGAYLALYDMDLTEELKDRIPVPVAVENDGKCGALAEVWKGNLSECKDGIVMILGTALAGGIIKDRRIHKGQNLSAGEFSYILLGEEPALKNTAIGKCGVAALLFEACRRKGIDVKKTQNYPLLGGFMDAQENLTEWNDRTEYAKGMDGYQFFQLLEAGDEDICSLYKEYTQNLAKMILNLQTIYAPEKILIGGGICRQSRLVVDIRKEYEKLQDIYLGIYTVPCEIEVCKFENEANQYGALYNFLQQYPIAIDGGK